MSSTTSIMVARYRIYNKESGNTTIASFKDRIFGKLCGMSSYENDMAKVTRTRKCYPLGNGQVAKRKQKEYYLEIQVCDGEHFHEEPID